MKESNCTPLAFIPLWAGVGCALSVLCGGENISSGHIAILVAIIGVIGTLIVTFLQLKRDGETINSIGSNTTDMKPRVENIEKDVEKAKDTLIESVKPSLKDISDRNEKIDQIYKEIEYHKRLQQELSENALGHDSLLAGINAVYAENARLNQSYRVAKETIIRLTNENSKLKKRVDYLERLQKPEHGRTQQWTFEP